MHRRLLILLAVAALPACGAGTGDPAANQATAEMGAAITNQAPAEQPPRTQPAR